MSTGVNYIPPTLSSRVSLTYFQPFHLGSVTQLQHFYLGSVTHTQTFNPFKCSQYTCISSTISFIYLYTTNDYHIDQYCTHLKEPESFLQSNLLIAELDEKFLLWYHRTNPSILHESQLFDYRNWQLLPTVKTLHLLIQDWQLQKKYLHYL